MELLTSIPQQQEHNWIKCVFFCLGHREKNMQLIESLMIIQRIKVGILMMVEGLLVDLFVDIIYNRII